MNPDLIMRMSLSAPHHAAATNSSAISKLIDSTSRLRGIDLPNHLRVLSKKDGETFLAIPSHIKLAGQRELGECPAPI